MKTRELWASGAFKQNMSTKSKNICNRNRNRNRNRNEEREKKKKKQICAHGLLKDWESTLKEEREMRRRRRTTEQTAGDTEPSDNQDPSRISIPSQWTGKETGKCSSLQTSQLRPLKQAESHNGILTRFLWQMRSSREQSRARNCTTSCLACTTDDSLCVQWRHVLFNSTDRKLVAQTFGFLSNRPLSAHYVHAETRRGRISGCKVLLSARSAKGIKIQPIWRTMEKTFVISSDDRHSTKTVKEIMSSFVLIYTLDNSFQMRMISSKNETRAALRRHFYLCHPWWRLPLSPPKDYGHGCDRVNDIPVGWQGKTSLYLW